MTGSAVSSVAAICLSKRFNYATMCGTLSRVYGAVIM